MLRLFTPHYRVSAVGELTPERLGLWGLCALLLDVDCTLTRYRQGDVLPQVAAWIEELRAAGIGLCLVSNGMGRRIQRPGRAARSAVRLQGDETVAVGHLGGHEKAARRACAHRDGWRSTVRRRDGRPIGGRPQHPRRPDPSRRRALVHPAESAGPSGWCSLG